MCRLSLSEALQLFVNQKPPTVLAGGFSMPNFIIQLIEASEGALFSYQNFAAVGMKNTNRRGCDPHIPKHSEEQEEE